MSRATFKEEASAPATPPTGYLVFYGKTDKKLYFKDDAGVEYPVKPVGAGTGDLLSDGSVPLSSDWDVGAFKLTAQQLAADIADGTTPLIITSTTQVDNLTAEWSSKTLGVVTPCRNSSGGILTKGTPVYVSGYHVGSEQMEVDAADATSAATMPALGLIFDDIANNANGYILLSGKLEGIDTSSFSVGVNIYIDDAAAGQVTGTRPDGTALVQMIGIVLRSHATLGVVEITGANRSNQLPNLAAGKIWKGDSNGVPQEALYPDSFEFTSDVPIVGDTDYVLWWDAPFAGTITLVRTKTQSGTCTVTGKIGATPLGGTANSASSSAEEQAHASANTFVKGDKILFTVSANAAALNLAVVFYGTRT